MRLSVCCVTLGLTLGMLVSACELLDDEKDVNDGPVQLTATWVPISIGRFEMGDETLASAEPVRTVELWGFEMKRTEVTVAEYAGCVNAGVCTAPDVTIGNCNWGVQGFENHPVNCVYWEQAATFCGWFGGRLPSEAEWEYAASSQGIPDSYPWGTERPSCDYAIMTDADSGIPGCGTARTWPVCSRPDGNTEQGLCDMGGNVLEWVQDHFHLDYTGNPPSNGTAWEEVGLEFRVIRGAAYNTEQTHFLNVAARGNLAEAVTQDSVGFRCAR